MQNNEEYIQEWFEKASHDLITARIAFQAGGPADSIAILLQQAAEKYLKGYLISKGWRLKKTHDLVELIKLAQEHNTAFGNYHKLANRLTSLYLLDKYPPVSNDTLDKEIKILVNQTEKLIAFIKEQA